jgi:hypothetical protein
MRAMPVVVQAGASDPLREKRMAAAASAGRVARSSRRCLSLDVWWPVICGGRAVELGVG